MSDDEQDAHIVFWGAGGKKEYLIEGFDFTKPVNGPIALKLDIAPKSGEATVTVEVTKSAMEEVMFGISLLTGEAIDGE